MNELRPEQTEGEQRREMAQILRLFFTRDFVIRRWLSTVKDLPCDDWLGTLDGCIQWPEAPDIDEGVTNSVNGLGPQIFKDLLAPSRKILADRWLGECEWELRDALEMILAFYQKVSQGSVLVYLIH